MNSKEMKEKIKKRPGGELDEEGNWFVLTKESKRLPDGYYKHQCGEDIIGVSIPLSNRDGLFPLSGDGSVRNIVVPYCPRCEKKPLRGEYGPGVGGRGWGITSWDWEH